MKPVTEMTAEELIEACITEYCKDGDHFKSEPFREFLARLRERDVAEHYADNHSGFPYPVEVTKYMDGLLATMHLARIADIQKKGG